MTTVSLATAADIDDFLSLESQLFAEDAGRHDPQVDIDWPKREGREDFAQLLDSESSLVLIARHDQGSPAVGMLVGYRAQYGSTRHPGTFAVLRSLFVAPGGRRSGAATALVEHFIEWARAAGCLDVTVDHYAANTGAAAFYEPLGFAPRSVSRVRRL